MHTTFLTITNGKIEIHADIGNLNAPAAYTADTAEDAAHWLLDHNITSWANSSTMDFGCEFGWHRDDVAAEIVAVMERIAEEEDYQ